ncbi:inovirus-type Gp2 protein [Nitrosomonas sp. Nm58]|jgi:hypothetical protein|uniref:YagK/YfjJ domain-containing protein n=1 Tax=Nitrosomonas sp. Nm58 TaxID=200126 RepID=UPI000897DA61|nr:inovirus-type Gp2 protein [Nitrosomonas sp. Nm58]SDZ21687.1 Protein of unknown function [Nitrosomonas sp. Nm58]
MASYKKLNEEDRDICESAIFDALIADRKTGQTSQNESAHSNASKMRSLESLLERVTEESYPELVPKLTETQHNQIMGSDRDRSHRRYILESLPSSFYIVKELPNKYYYSETVEVFISHCKVHSTLLIDSSFHFFCQNPAKYFNVFGEPSYERIREFVNKFIRELHQRLRNPKTRKKILDRRRAIEKNYQELIEYVDGLFARNARLLVLRIDLAYKKYLNVSVEDLAKDLDHLHANMRHNRQFHHLVGYIEKIEYGVEKGVHAHLILFFDGSKRKNDSYLAKEIGEYWHSQITKEQGNYWNCNDPENKKQLKNIGRLGIGEIHAEDKEKRDNLNYIIRYFCKKEQFIKLKTKPKMKLIRKGQCPKQIGPKRGAPRASQRIVQSPHAIGDRPAFSNGFPYWGLPFVPQLSL